MVKAAREPERMYRVVSPFDGSILCASCSLPVAISATIDGRANGKRGHICPTCQSRYSAVPIGNHRPKAGSQYTVIRPLSKNSEQQDEVALFGEAVIAEYRRQDRPLGYGVMLQGANWAHTGDSRWITSAGSQPAHPRDCSCLEHNRAARIGASYYPSVKYGDTLAHLQGLNAGIRAPRVHFIPRNVDSIARYALTLASEMISPIRSHVRASARVADFDCSLPRASAPLADPPMHLRPSYLTLMRHAKRASGKVPTIATTNYLRATIPPDLWT